MRTARDTGAGRCTQQPELLSQPEQVSTVSLLGVR